MAPRALPSISKATPDSAGDFFEGAILLIVEQQVLDGVVRDQYIQVTILIKIIEMQTQRFGQWDSGAGEK